MVLSQRPSTGEEACERNMNFERKGSFKKLFSFGSKKKDAASAAG